METDFIYWKHNTPVGIRVEEVFDGEAEDQKLWLEMAYQILCDHGDNGTYRELLHYPDGAPYIGNSPQRISITHTKKFLAVAFLPKTPDMDLSVFNPRTAMGIDAENLERSQVIKLRSKFLSEAESNLIDAEDVKANIMAWTAKEALYKAALTPGLSFTKDIIITSLPPLVPNPVARTTQPPILGEAVVYIRDNEEYAQGVPMNLYSYESEGNCVTLAFSPKYARFSS